ncbi:MAG TPA: histidinol-phosphate transaminase [Dehalococcoidia bacterium]
MPQQDQDREARQPDPLRLVRRALRGLEPYEPVEPVEVLAERLGVPRDRIVKLDGNENPYGPSPRVLEALARAGSYHIYPDPDQRAVRRALAEYTGAPEEMIVAGNGSDEIIDLLCRLFLEPDDTVIDCVPTFGMYAFSAQVCGGRVANVPRLADRGYRVDAGAVAERVDGRTKIIFLASPNNPTGNLLSREELEALLELGPLVVVDEAYGEFAGETFLPLVRERENLVVLRTFSKWAGLAGIRAGYGVMPPRIASLVMAIKPPYNLTVPAEVAVLASLADRDLLLERVRRIVAERERLFQALKEVPYLEPLPSRANFILCRVRRGDARLVRDRLQERGIFIRYFRRPLLENCIRVSVGRPEDTDALVSALHELGGELEHA